MLHAAVPLARLTASFTLAEREAGGSGPISHSQLMESEPGVGVSHPACSSWTTCGSGPHGVLVQGMSGCMLSQGGDSWAPALQEMGVGLLHIKNLLRKLSGMIPMFLPQWQFPWRMEWVQPQDPQRNSLAPHPLPAFRRLVRVLPRVKGGLQPQLPCLGVARKRRRRPSGCSTVLCARWQ